MKSRDSDSEEFRIEYERLLSFDPSRELPSATPGTLDWLVLQYMGSQVWRNLKPSTRRQRSNVFKNLCAKHGHRDYRKLDMRAVRSLRNAKDETPGAANNLVKVIRALYVWAIEANHADHNPARDVKRLRTKDGGFKTWSTTDVAKYIERHPRGTKAYLALAILICTAFRRGDASTFGPQHIITVDGRKWFSQEQEKTGLASEFPVSPLLLDAIAVTRTGKTTFLINHYGKPFSKEGFGNWFRERCDEAGLHDLAAHGVRKFVGTFAAESELTEHQIMVLLGHSSPREASTYTRAANRRKLAMSAASRLALTTPAVPELTTLTVTDCEETEI